MADTSISTGASAFLSSAASMAASASSRASPRSARDARGVGASAARAVTPDRRAPLTGIRPGLRALPDLPPLLPLPPEGALGLLPLPPDRVGLFVFFT